LRPHTEVAAEVTEALGAELVDAPPTAAKAIVPALVAASAAIARVVIGAYAVFLSTFRCVLGWTLADTIEADFADLIAAEGTLMAAGSTVEETAQRIDTLSVAEGQAWITLKCLWPTAKLMTATLPITA
jgi:hypothetical protein